MGCRCDGPTGTAPCRHGVPGLRALAAHDCRRNLAFGLRAQRLPDEEVKKRVGHALEVTRLEAFSTRYPSELSGGQQQRVAIARALASRPALLLFDEPLSNLDAALREDMRGEMMELVHRESMTVVYVTHDQAEAMAVSDRIAVMRAGTDRPVRHASANLRSASGFVRGELHWRLFAGPRKRAGWPVPDPRQRHAASEDRQRACRRGGPRCAPRRCATRGCASIQPIARDSSFAGVPRPMLAACRRLRAAPGQARLATRPGGWHRA